MKGAVLETGHGSLDGAVSRDDDGADLGIDLANLSQQSMPVQLRNSQVGDHDVHRPAPDDLQRDAAVACLLDLGTEVAEETDQ